MGHPFFSGWPRRLPSIRRGILRTHAGRSAPRDGRSSQQGERQARHPHYLRRHFSSTGMGIIWGPARDIARVPECICYDWLHNLCASGGVGAYHANQFPRAVAQAGVILADSLAFLQRVVLPKSNRTLGSFTFEQRTADNPSAPIRASASDVLSPAPRWR